MTRAKKPETFLGTIVWSECSDEALFGILKSCAGEIESRRALWMLSIRKDREEREKCPDCAGFGWNYNEKCTRTVKCKAWKGKGKR